MNLSPDSRSPEPQTAPESLSATRRGTRGRWLAGAVLLVLAVPASLVAANWVWKAWYGPKVDPLLTAPVTISLGSDRNTDPAAASSSQTSTGGAATNDGAMSSPEVLEGLLAGISQTAIDSAPHPLDPVLEVARKAREKIRAEIRDYTATMVNEVRLDDGELREQQYLLCKVRHARQTEDGAKTPFSIYTRFLAPQSKLGQEAIWVEGQRDDHLVAHLPPGLTNLMRWTLHPESPTAMSGNRYPIWDIGIVKLLDKMIEKGERDRAAGPCQVRLDPSARINDQPCLMIEVRHDTQRPPYDYHIARIYIDRVQQLPVAYEGYLWPETPGGEPLLLERYIYQDLKLNPGLTDTDFDPDNPAYDYPGKKSPERP